MKCLWRHNTVQFANLTLPMRKSIISEYRKWIGIDKNYYMQKIYFYSVFLTSWILGYSCSFEPERLFLIETISISHCDNSFGAHISALHFRPALLFAADVFYFPIKMVTNSYKIWQHDTFDTVLNNYKYLLKIFFTFFRKK